MTEGEGDVLMNIETPCLIIDYDIMKRNIEKMAQISKNSGCVLRPHTKTHKIPEIAKIQIEAGANGITAAKVSEAEVMADNGIKDIFIAYPVIGEMKIKRVLELNKKIRLIVGVDSVEGAEALSSAALTAGQTIEVRLEVDTGLRRTGVTYEKAVDFAQVIDSYKGIRLTGIFTFKGLVFEGKGTLERERAGFEEGCLMVELAGRLREKGINIKDVSVGSTPTAIYAAQVKGVTEIRPGTYVFNDMMLVNMDVCSIDECAASILTTVVSCNANDYAVVDGGNKTFSTDAALGVFPHYLKGYGRTMQDDQLVLERLSEEHGIITLGEGAKTLKVGDTISIIPNHICTTVNLHDRAYFVKTGQVINEVSIKGRGRVY